MSCPFCETANEYAGWDRDPSYPMPQFLRFTGENGNHNDKTQASFLGLVAGQVYEVEKIMVGGFRSRVYLKRHPTIGLNSVMFEPVAPNWDKPVSSSSTSWSIVTVILVAILMIILVGARSCHGASPANSRVTRLLNAMEKQESGGRLHAVGDQGRSRGPLQIQRNYWVEGCRAAKVKLDYKTHVWDRGASRTVVMGYWKAHYPTALRRGDLETLARTHNGGPAGPKKSATAKYWKAVKGKM